MQGSPNKLLQEALEVLANSYSPYSNFPVGASLLSSCGKIYQGCNVENASYGGTVCAERTAFLKAVSEGVREFEAVLVVTPTKKTTPPCALCLQTMAEFCGPDFLVYLANQEGILEKHKFKDLLAYPFGPPYLKADS